MAETLSKRGQTRARQRRQRMMGRLAWGGVGTVALAVVGLIIWQGARPRVGEVVPVMKSEHIPTESDPGQYNSDPPTSGPHYAEEASGGFYDTNNYRYPAAHLVHNLEHGYVVFWYNCDRLSENSCTELKVQIRSLMDDIGAKKLIAYPWPSLDTPLAMTSWGRLETFETFDAEGAKAFVNANIGRAPEPDAP